MSNYKFDLPRMSWEQPIEEEMLDWLMHMTSQMEMVANGHDNKDIREGASNMAKAYRTAGEHLVSQIKLRQK